MYKALFEPIQIGNVEIKNRIALAPACMNFSTPEGYVSDQNIAYYAARAKGGAGLIIQEAAMASAMWQGCPPDLDVADDAVWEEYTLNYKFGQMLKIYHEVFVSGMAEIVDAVHDFGSKIFLQILGCWGRQAMHTPEEMMIAPSPIPFEVPEENIPKGVDIEMERYLGCVGTGPTPREARKSEMDRIIKDTARSALLARQAGYDGVEVHCAHGYFPAEFLSPRSNQRKDEYGGSIENRMRFPIELATAVRKAVGDTIAVGVRMSEDEHMPGGMTHKDALIVAQEMEKAGMDYFLLSSGSYEGLKFALPEKNGTMLDPARDFKEKLNIPVITPSVHDPAMAEQAIMDGKTDMVAMARQLLADPDWPNKVRDGRSKEIVKCTRCNTCWNHLWRPQALRCSQNPNLGRERFMPEYWRPGTLKFKKMKPGVWE